MKQLLLAMGLICAAASPARGQGNGIFADFSTSLGEFTVQLDYVRAPRAVAGFVGLATGEGGWLDGQTNLWHFPFYDGSIFHRVVIDSGTGNRIAIQGGGFQSRTVNTNTGTVTTNFLGPGYTMLESVTNGLAHSNGVISMANSGPNTDGSQFFITTTNVPGWNGGYTVFGHVAAGMDVVHAIAAVPVAGERPATDVVLSNVVIRRTGAAAEAFAIDGHGVPSPESTPIGARRSNDTLILEIELAAQTTPLMLSESADMHTWSHDPVAPGLTLYTGSPQVMSGQIPLADLGRKYFFFSSRIRYPEPITSPVTHLARTFTFDWAAPDLTYQMTFATNWGAAGVGWVQEGTNAPVARTSFGFSDSWTRDAYMGRLTFTDDLGREYRYNLGFNPGEATHRFTGDWGNSGSSTRYPMSGTFTLD